jgi:hypothetical protein
MNTRAATRRSLEGERLLGSPAAATTSASASIPSKKKKQKAAKSKPRRSLRARSTNDSENANDYDGEVTHVFHYDDNEENNVAKNNAEKDWHAEYIRLEERQASEWRELFQEIVSHRRLLMNKVKQKLEMSRQFLLRKERARADADMRAIEQGFDSYVHLVLDDGKYREFADSSNKTQRIVTSHDRAQAILNFLQLTDRQRINFAAFLDETTTPEAVTKKCADLNASDCEAPCHKTKSKFFGLQSATCEFDG